MSNAISPDFDLALSDVEAAWLAACIDGEGSVCITKQMSIRAKRPTYVVRVSCSNTSLAFVERVAELASPDRRTITASPRVSRRGERTRDVYNWSVDGRRGAAVLRAVRPWLIIKGEQADLALLIHDLNQRGFGKGNPLPDHLAEVREQARQTVSDLNHGRAPVSSFGDLAARI